MEFGYFTLSDNAYPDNPRTAAQFVREIRVQAVLAETLGDPGRAFGRAGAISPAGVVATGANTPQSTWTSWRPSISSKNAWTSSGMPGRRTDRGRMEDRAREAQKACFMAEIAPAFEGRHLRTTGG